MEPLLHCGKILQLHIGQPKSWTESYPNTLLKLLVLLFREPKTLEDISLTMTTVEQVHQMLYNIWMKAPTGSNPVEGDEAPPPLPPLSMTGPAAGLFENEDLNQIWRVLASQTMEDYNQLADIDMLKPDPANSKQVM